MTSELDELLSTIESTNSSLMKLSMIIRTSPLRDGYLKAATRCKLDPSWDIGHLREKHGSAKRSSSWLLERLGKSITRRRECLLYRKDHHDKLAVEWGEDAKDIEGNEPGKTNCGNQTHKSHNVHSNESCARQRRLGSRRIIWFKNLL
jgi:hypothetical protein